MPRPCTCNSIPCVVFHEHGYRGGSQSMLENFAAGRYIGVPMLQWRGLCLDEKSAVPLGVKPYPHMLRLATQARTTPASGA